MSEQHASEMRNLPIMIRNRLIEECGVLDLRPALYARRAERVKNARK